MVCVRREQEGLCFAGMQACLPSYSKYMGKYFQSFIKKNGAVATSNTLPSLSVNERAVVSIQDGSGWAIAVGAVICVQPGPKVEMALDKAVPTTENTLYRIDKAPGYSGKLMAGNLADFCSSEAERYYIIYACSPCK